MSPAKIFPRAQRLSRSVSSVVESLHQGRDAKRVEKLVDDAPSSISISVPTAVPSLERKAAAP